MTWSSAFAHPTAPLGGARRALGLAALLGCLASLSLGAGVAHAIGTGSVEGTVTNHGGQDIKGIVVAVVNEEGTKVGGTTTASNGTYTVAGISAGEYTVVFSDETETYLTKSVPAVKVEEGKVSTENVVLTKAGSIAGQVTSAATHAPLSGVNVEIEGPEGAAEEGFYHTTTEANGHYRVKHLGPGKYEIVVFDGGEYLSQNISILLDEGEEHVVNVPLSEGGKITGTVTNAYTHAGLEKIGVYAYVPGHVGRSASTNSKGEYTITELAGGAYVVVYSWEYSEVEEKEYEKAPAFIPKYITQYYTNQISAASANPVSVNEGSTTSGVNVAMVPSAPHNTAAPTISGTALVGDTLTCANGSWTGEGLLSVQSGWPLATPFGYQWLREGSAISGATSASYLVQTADEGHGLACEVTATNAAGHEATKSGSVTVPRPAIATSTSKLSFVNGSASASIGCTYAPCAGAAEVTTRVAAKHGRKRTVVIARGSYSLAASAHGTVKLHLTESGATMLLAAKHRRAAGELVIAVTQGKTVERAVIAEVTKKK